MYTEAFLFVGSLLQDGKIEQVIFEKDEFKVKFKGEERLIPYDYTSEDVIVLLKDIENLENKK